NQHLYQEVNDFCEEGLKIDPGYYPLLSIQGQNYIRMAGKDKDGKDFEQKGREKLEAAYKKDHYEVRTVNLLNLYEQVIDNHYTFFDAKPFRFRVEQGDQDILSKYIPQLMKGAYDLYVKKYGVTPELVQVELYTDNTDYATRTVGRPGLEALGV